MGRVGGQGPRVAYGAALVLISRSRPLPEIVARLTPGELEQIVGVIGRWPDCFPHGTLAALRSLRATMSRPNHQPASRRLGRISAKGLHTRAHALRFGEPISAKTLDTRAHALRLGSKHCSPLSVAGLSCPVFDEQTASTPARIHLLWSYPHYN